MSLERQLIIFSVVFCGLTIPNSQAINFSEEFHPDPIEYTRCSPYYCSNKFFVCEPISCTKDQIETSVPEWCICCSKCFKKLCK